MDKEGWGILGRNEAGYLLHKENKAVLFSFSVSLIDDHTS